MSTISKEEVKKLARLSKIAISEAEAQKFTTELEAILRYVEQLNAIDTSNTAPTSQVTGLENVNRQDEEIDYGVDREALLENAPAQQDGYIKVKRVLK